MPTAPIAAGPSRPTIAMSTSPIAIHPSSATTIGVARRMVGGSSPRSARSAAPGAAGRAGSVVLDVNGVAACVVSRENAIAPLRSSVPGGARSGLRCRRLRWPESGGNDARWAPDRARQRNRRAV